MATYLAPNASWLAIALALDFLFGDPVYAAHPVRLMGCTLSAFERALRKLGFDGYGGGIALFALLSVTWCGLVSAPIVLLSSWSVAAALVHIFFLYSFLALHDLLRHCWSVERAARRGDLLATHAAIRMLVGRDTAPMDIAACRRAAIESLSENLTDGFISPLFWYAIGGLPGIVLFKVVSTMDSMVGYKTPEYLRFGWCGARLDDLMNWLPARLSWLLIGASALIIPGCSLWSALRVGWQQHSLVPGPNSGWSEAAAAGAIQRRIAGPIWKDGALVSDVWLGNPLDVPAGEHKQDMLRATCVVTLSGIFAATLAIVASAVR